MPVYTTVPLWLYTTTTGPLVYGQIDAYPSHPIQTQPIPSDMPSNLMSLGSKK